MSRIKHALSLVLLAFTVTSCGGGGSGTSAASATQLQGPTERVAILDPVQGEVVAITLSTDNAPMAETIAVSSGRNLALDQSNQTLYLSSYLSGYSITTLNYQTGQQRTFGDEVRSDYLIKAPDGYLYSVYTQTTMTDNILRPRTQGYVQRISSETGEVEFSDLFGTPEFSALAVHPSTGILYAVEPKVQASNSDPLCLQDTCDSQVTVYSLAINENTNPYSGGITTQWFQEMVTTDFMNIRDARFSPDGSKIYLAGAPGELWSADLINSEILVIRMLGLPEYKAGTYLDVEAGGATALIAAQDLGLYRMDLSTGKTSRLAGPDELFTGVAGLRILD